MDAPLEDEIIKFIAGKRFLKLPFLAIALISILGTAYSTLQAPIEFFRPYAFRFLNIGLKDVDKEKYACAYFSGAAQWNIIQSANVALSQGDPTVSGELLLYEEKLVKCQTSLGYTPSFILIGKSTKTSDLDSYVNLFRMNLSAFSGSLQVHDRFSYLIYQIGYDTAYMQTQMSPIDPEARRVQSESLLIPIDAKRADRLRRNVKEVSSACPCKFPEVVVKTGNLGELIESANAIDAAMEKFLPLD